MKKLFVPLAILLLFAYYWRATSSRYETGSSTISSWKPVAASEPPVERQTSSTAPARPVVAVAKPAANRADVVAAFERKRRAAGNENAAPLPPPMDAFKDIPKTEEQTINDRPYHVLGATAIARERYTGSMGKLLLEQNGFAVVEMKNAETMDQAIFRNDARPVLVNPNGRVAIVTGTMLVKVRDLASIDAIAAAEGMELVGKDEDTRTAFMKPPEGYHLLAGQKRLQSDARIERVELELYQSRKERK